MGQRLALMASSISQHWPKFFNDLMRRNFSIALTFVLRRLICTKWRTTMHSNCHAIATKYSCNTVCWSFFFSSLLFLGKLLDYNFYPICDRNGVKSLTKFANQFFSLISNWMSGFPVHSSSFYYSSLFALLEHPKEVHRRKKNQSRKKANATSFLHILGLNLPPSHYLSFFRGFPLCELR